MSDFKDIQVGDKVFVLKKIGVDFGQSKSFCIPAIITKITKTQFTAGGRNFQKDGGKQIGGEYGEEAYRDGSVFYGSRIAKDESKELENFKIFLNKIRSMLSILDGLGKNPYTGRYLSISNVVDNLSLEDVEKISILVSEAKEILNKKLNKES